MIKTIFIGNCHEFELIFPWQNNNSILIYVLRTDKRRLFYYRFLSGGRNHVPCCYRRDVSDRCISICENKLITDISRIPHVDKIFKECLGMASDIVSCFEEGQSKLKGLFKGSYILQLFRFTHYHFNNAILK